MLCMKFSMTRIRNAHEVVIMRPNEERQEKMAHVIYGDFVVTIIRPFARIVGLLPTQTRMEKHNKPWEKTCM